MKHLSVCISEIFIYWIVGGEKNLQPLQTMYAYICLVYQTFSSFYSPEKSACEFGNSFKQTADRNWPWFS